MSKPNPNRQELIQFINSNSCQLIGKIAKIQDLSSGVHYLHLLHQLHPDVVKLRKVNLKATHQHQNINNLKLLGLYFCQVKAPFTFQVTKASQRNYQQNLNLLKNLYKYFHIQQTQKRQSSLTSRVSLRNPLHKITVKVPQKITKPLQMRKIPPPNDGIKNVFRQTQSHAQQIRSIMVVVGNGHEDSLGQAAQKKIARIQKILGLQFTHSCQEKTYLNTRSTAKYSDVCSGLKSSSKKNIDGAINKYLKTQQIHITRTQDRSQIIQKPQNPEHQAQSKKGQKKFDCQEIKECILKRYDLRPNSKRKSIRVTKDTIQIWLKEQQQEDIRYNQNLLSPQPEKMYKNKQRQTSRRKSIIKSQIDPGQSVQNNQNTSQNKKKVNFSLTKPASQKNQKKELTAGQKSTVKKKPAEQIAQLPSQRKKKVSENPSITTDIQILVITFITGVQ